MRIRSKQEAYIKQTGIIKSLLLLQYYPSNLYFSFIHSPGFPRFIAPSINLLKAFNSLPGGKKIESPQCYKQNIKDGFKAEQSYLNIWHMNREIRKKLGTLNSTIAPLRTCVKVETISKQSRAFNSKKS